MREFENGCKDESVGMKKKNCLEKRFAVTERWKRRKVRRRERRRPSRGKKMWGLSRLVRQEIEGVLGCLR